MEYLTIEEIEKQAASEHTTAEQLDILVSKTKELTTLREHELSRLKNLLQDLEKKLNKES